jgi:hypothetical protein
MKVSAMAVRFPIRGVFASEWKQIVRRMVIEDVRKHVPPRSAVTSFLSSRAKKFLLTRYLEQYLDLFVAFETRFRLRE